MVYFPKIIEIEGVNTSPFPRKMPISTNESRYKTAKKTYGNPLTDYQGESNPYIDYQSIDLLLSLQHPRSNGYDEMCFYVMGQVKEILSFELFLDASSFNSFVDIFSFNCSIFP